MEERGRWLAELEGPTNISFLNPHSGGKYLFVSFFLAFLQSSTKQCHSLSFFSDFNSKITMTKCKIVLLFSGKRKSGKDHITDLLASRLGEQAKIIRLVRLNFIEIA